MARQEILDNKISRFQVQRNRRIVGLQHDAMYHAITTPDIMSPRGRYVKFEYGNSNIAMLPDGASAAAAGIILYRAMMAGNTTFSSIYQYGYLGVTYREISRIEEFRNHTAVRLPAWQSENNSTELFPLAAL